MLAWHPEGAERSVLKYQSVIRRLTPALVKPLICPRLRKAFDGVKKGYCWCGAMFVMPRGICRMRNSKEDLNRSTDKLKG